MNFTKTDFMILVASMLFITFTTFIFPHLGLFSTATGGNVDDVNETNFPSFSISDAKIEVVGDRPMYPRTAVSGELRYNVDRTHTWQEILERVGDENGDGFDDEKVFLETFCWNNDPANETCDVQLTEFKDNSQVGQDSYIMNKSDFPDNATKLDSGNYSVRIEFIEQENWNTSGLEYSLKWNILSGTDDSIFSGIPILGETAKAVSALISIIKWGFLTFFWFSAWIVELTLSAISILLTSFFYLFHITFYIVDIQVQIIDVASNRISVFIAIINVLFLAEAAKIVLLFIKALPTT